MRAHSFAVLATLVVSASTASGQSLALAMPRAATLTAPKLLDPAYVQAMLNRADTAATSGRSSEARRLYRTLADELKRAEQYAGTALWRLALNQLYEDKVFDAARTLDELADAADQHGDPAMEMRASFEAAVLWHQLGRRDLVSARLNRAQALLESPVISAEDKAFYQRRLEAGSKSPA